MKQFRKFLVSTLVGGLMVLAPIYIAVLLLLRATKSLEVLVSPLAQLLPDWFPAAHLLSFLVVLLLCFFVGLALRTRPGRAARAQVEKSVLERIPGYTVVRGLTQQVAGTSGENAWKPALVEIEEALVPAFIIEEHDDGRFTVFVPSVPTPFAGAVYILTPERVHPVDIPFTQAIQSIGKWGSGAKEFVAAMKQGGAVIAPRR